MNASNTPEFLGTPATVRVADKKTAIVITASLDYSAESDGSIDGFFETCVQHGSNPIKVASLVEPNFNSVSLSYFAQTITGAASGLAAGTYKAGVCSSGENNDTHGYGTGVVQVIQTTGGVVPAAPVPAFRSKVRQGSRH